MIWFITAALIVVLISLSDAYVKNKSEDKALAPLLCAITSIFVIYALLVITILYYEHTPTPTTQPTKTIWRSA